MITNSSSTKIQQPVDEAIVALDGLSLDDALDVCRRALLDLHGPADRERIERAMTAAIAAVREPRA